ncbi:MAG TPA: VOC family protein [Acidimicrobiales bacterium]|nr:VOC family protein [Acidimicrobiales bacterium]
MADPFEALRAPVEPVEPDPAFAADLRSQVRDALDPRGDTMSSFTLERETPAVLSPVTGVTPYLAVDDARRALGWYVETLGARLRGEPVVMPDGRIGHAELDLAGDVVMLADEFPEIGVVAPRAAQGTTVTLHLTVGDVDAVTARAVDAGATLERPPADHPYGRNAVIRDPFAHRWLLASEPAPVPAEAEAAVRPGDVAYVSLWVPDVERAAAFFGAVLGWRYAPGGGLQGRQVQDVTPSHGLWGGQDHSTLFLCFAVDDMEAAVRRVGAAGGRAEEPRSEPYGLVADCVDDQGLPFALVSAPAGSGDAERPADLAYITMGVPDAARARAFYGSVLGWRFTPGRTPGGWNVEGVQPMMGMAGGQDPPTVVPMYRVDDVAAAVHRVRDAGGTATDPEQQPYGVTAVCTDDQGTTFYLGQV